MGGSLSYYYFMVASSYAYYNHKYAPMEPKSASNKIRPERSEK